MIDVTGGKEVIADIGVDIGIVHAPLDRGRDATDLADQLLLQ
jgi:hypothetical protein